MLEIDFYENEEKAYQEMYSQYGKCQFIKTIRADSDDFFSKFVRGVLGQSKDPLRMKRHVDYKYKVAWRNGKAVVLEFNEQTGKFSSPQFSAKEKLGKSKKQSTSVVSSKEGYLTKVFGSGNYREDFLTGIIFFTKEGGESISDKEIVMPSLIFKKDAGTVTRTYYFKTEQDANQYIQDKGLYSTVAELIANNKNSSISHNEVLARLQWIPNDPRCHIGIFSNNLGSKLLAQLRAIDLQINTKAKFIPISFYNDQNKSNPFSGYLVDDQKKDIAEALLLDYFIGREKPMALLIKKYSDTQQGIQSNFSMHQNIQCLRVLLSLSFTKTTFMEFLNVIFDTNYSTDLLDTDDNAAIKNIFNHFLSRLRKDTNIDYDFIMLFLKKNPNLSNIDYNNFLYIFYKILIPLQDHQKQLEFFKTILAKLDDTTLEKNVIDIFSMIYNLKDDQKKSEFLEIILNTLSGNPLKEALSFLSFKLRELEDNQKKLRLLEIILNKLSGKSLEEELSFLLLHVELLRNDQRKSELLEKILNKLPDINIQKNLSFLLNVINDEEHPIYYNRTFIIKIILSKLLATSVEKYLYTLLKNITTIYCSPQRSELLKMILDRLDVTQRKNKQSEPQLLTQSGLIFSSAPHRSFIQINETESNQNRQKMFIKIG